MKAILGSLASHRAVDVVDYIRSDLISMLFPKPSPIVKVLEYGGQRMFPRKILHSLYRKSEIFYHFKMGSA